MCFPFGLNSNPDFCEGIKELNSVVDSHGAPWLLSVLQSQGTWS